MPATANTPKPTTLCWRPQFSLRTFIVAVTVAGIGFPAWYRLPYEETAIPSQEIVVDPYCGQRSHKDPDYLYGWVTKTWQRQFGGHRLEHGWCRRYDHQGRLKIEEEYRNGELHGRQRIYATNGTVVQEGLFECGLKEGIWTTRSGEHFKRGPMHRGRRHGVWIYRSFDHTRHIAYCDGRVAAVEDLSVDRTFEAQFPQTEEDGIRWRPLMDRSAMLGAVEESLVDVASDWEFQTGVPVFLDEMVEEDFLVHESWDNLCLADALQIVCLPRGLTPVYRYGGICLTAVENHDDWTDPTGVSDLQYPQGSTLATVWSEPVSIHSEQTPLADALSEIAANLKVNLDTSRIERTLDNPDGYPVTSRLADHPFHHALAYLLYKTGCRCELKGQTLVVLPPADAPATE